MAYATLQQLTLRLILFDIVDTFVAAIGASDGESTTTHQAEEKP